MISCLRTTVPISKNTKIAVSISSLELASLGPFIRVIKSLILSKVVCNVLHSGPPVIMLSART